MEPGGLRAIDRVQLVALLRAYFRMSSRGVSLIKGKSGAPTSLAYVLAMYLLIGAVVGAGAFAHPDVFTYCIFVHALTFFVVGMAAVVESNDVLFDSKEDELLLHRPIHPSTLLAAKALALVGFSLLLAFAVNVVPTFTGLALEGAQPWFPLVHIVSTVGLVVFSCAAVVCTYGIVLRLFGRERFENLAVYSQVGMMLVFVGGMQILPRVLERFDKERIASVVRWLLPVPPGWFAALDASLAGGAWSLELALAAGFGLLITAFLAWFAVGRLATGYGELASPKGRVKPAVVEESAARADRAPRGGSWHERNRLLRGWIRDPVEWASFRLAAAYMRRDRDVRLRLYSSISMFLVFIVLSIIDPRRERTAFLPLMMLVMSGTIPLTVIETLRMSPHSAAAEAFSAAPLASWAPLFHGVRKASVLFVQLPLASLAVLMMVLLDNAEHTTLQIAIPIALILPLLSLLPGMFGSYVPLSTPPRRGRQSSQNAGVAFGTMALAGTMCGLGFAARHFGLLWPFVGAEFVIVALLHRGISLRIAGRPMPALTSES